MCACDKTQKALSLNEHSWLVDISQIFLPCCTSFNILLPTTYLKHYLFGTVTQ